LLKRVKKIYVSKNIQYPMQVLNMIIDLEANLASAFKGQVLI